MSVAARRFQRTAQSGTLQSVIKQQNTGTWNGTSANITLPASSSTGSTLVLIVAGNTVVTTPSGWTLRESQVNSMGHYLYTQTGTALSSWSMVTAAGTGTWWVAEITNAQYDVSASSHNTIYDISYSTPLLTPTIGQRMVISSLASNVDSSAVRTVSNWTNDFIEIADLCSPSADYPMQGVATRIVSASGNSAYSTSATYSQNSGRSAIICALSVVAASENPGNGGDVMTLFQDFTAATWGAASTAKTSGDGKWRIAGDWIGTGGNTLTAANGTIDFSSSGTLSLKCSANSTNAAEIQSLLTYGHGYFECRMKVGKVVGTCQSFFLIGDGYGPGEIDFEFLTGGDGGGWLNTATGAVMVNVHPVGNAAVQVSLPFNPCDAYHVYGILWKTSSIDFVVDGIVMHTWNNLPSELGSGAEKVYVMANNWTAQDASWGGGPPTQDAIAQYDYFKVWEGVTTIPAGAIGGSMDAVAPTQPTNLTATPSSNSAALSWTASTDNVGVAGYEYSLNGSTYNATGSSSPSYVVLGLSSSTTYTISIRAFDAAGNRSNAASVTTTSTAPISGGASVITGLSYLPWEGGSEYWAQYPKAVAAGWTSPSFFPMMSFSNSFSSDEEIEWDRAHGINVYHGLNPYSPYDLLSNHDMYYVGNPYADAYSNTMMPSSFAKWVGYNTPDEIDGTSGSGPNGLATVTTMSNEYRAQNDGRFICANYTQMVVSTSFQPYGEQYINHSGVDAVSIDMYWYTIPNSSFGNSYVSDVTGPTAPRTASAYGAMVRGLRQLNDQGPKKKPMWMFVECLSGSPGEQFVRYIDPNELKGAVMSSIINEARGIMWFNNVASEGYSVGNVLRQAQVQGSNFVGHNQIVAMQQVNTQVHALAPVINTQSYIWNFGANVETMLKGHGGFAYIFAMCSNASVPGSRTLTLPGGISGTSVEVVDENRTITIDGNRQFIDTFAAEYTYHIYKIAI